VNLERIHVVLLRPDDPLNIGAVARAMRNCELSKLTLVAPKKLDLVTARRVARHAEDLLAAPRVVDSLAEALTDAVWVVGTTSRSIEGRPPISPRQVATEADRLSDDGEVAIVFGCEESGLSNEDLLGCHAISRISAGRAQPSYNLAQSVLLYAYEIHEAALKGVETRPVEVHRAPESELVLVEQALGDLLTHAGFADLSRPRHGVRDMALALRRAGLTVEEAKLWHAALRRAVRAFERLEKRES
jgi:TrmH family RNA methyltransferase